MVLRFFVLSAAFLPLVLVSCGDKPATSARHTSAKAPAPSPPGMAWIPGGKSLMGSSAAPHEGPVHEIEIDGFWMDEHEVTNAQFEAFVKATGYVTLAERVPKIEDFPEEIRARIDPDQLKPGALVFACPSEAPKSLDNYLQWWRYAEGASWRQPDGPNSNLEGKENHPVVCVAWEDAAAYAKWAGKRLPTEAEWEYAAWGGQAPTTYIWGDSAEDRTSKANTWTGDFPMSDKGADGFKGTAPVKTYPSNAYGLYDMAGNVWEHVADWYQPNYFAVSPKLNPPGPNTGYDPNEPGVPKRVIKGGSYLCNPVYCTGYRPSARMATSTDTASAHTGFRCVKSVSDK